MSVSNERHNNRILDIGNKILMDKKAATTSTSTTTTKVGNNNEIVMEGREELEFEVVSQHEEDEEDEDVVVEVQRPAIQTLVFFDVEATGLQSSTSKPRITELSLVAVNTSDLLEMASKLSTRKPSEDFERVSIRVINKLTLCVNPTSLIMPKIKDLTGLDNYNLETQRSFSTRTTLILESFLEHLPKPVCLVAHHGLGYDFPLLRSELLKSESDLDPKVLVVDSLDAFKQIFAEQNAADEAELASQSKHDPIFDDDDDFSFPLLDDVDPPDNDQVFTHKEVLENSQYPSASSTPVKSGEKLSQRRKMYQLPLTPPTTSSKRSRLDDVEASLISPTVNNTSIKVEPASSHVKELLEVHSTNEIRDDNEVTPDRSAISGPPRSFGAPVKARKFAAPSDRFLEVSRARKRLDFSRTSPQSFSLANIHSHIFGKTPTVSHGAEEDCLTLMRICAAQGNSFVSYVEKNAQPFSQVGKLW